MTVITEPVVNIAGLDDTMDVTFFVDEPRRRNTGHGIVTTMRVKIKPVAKVLTTPELNPGVAKVRFGTNTYDIVIPDSATPVPLWPLIEAGLPAPAQNDDFVFNAGGVPRIQAKSTSEYSAMPKDPATLYVLFIEGA